MSFPVAVLFTLATATQAADPACILDSRQDAIVRMGPEQSSGSQERVLLPDLDADGEADHAWSHSATCGASGNCTEHLYLTGGGCTAFAGELNGVQLEVLGNAGQPYPDLWAFWRSGCAGAEGTVVVYRFDKGEYRPAAQTHCPCPVHGATTPAACQLRDEDNDEARQAVRAWVEAAITSDRPQ